MILTLIPIRPFYQTSDGMASAGDGRLRMRRLASLSTLFPSYVHLYLYTETRPGWRVQETADCACVGSPHSPPCFQAMSICICILKLGRGGECRRRPSAHASACWLHDHIRKVTLSQKKPKMSETVRAVGRERNTIIVTYIGFRPPWSSNVELILHWDVYDQV